MTFAWPHVLWALALPLYWLLRPSRQTQPSGAGPERPHIARAEADAAVVREAGKTSIWREPKVWIAYAVACAVIALARPQWGYQEQVGMLRSREILVALDLSRSMLTPDVAPSRLERAKLLTESLLDQLQGERIGLMVFAGSPFLQAPLSTDYAILREFLPAMDPDYLPDQGTDYGALLAAVPGAFAATGPADRFLVLLSDGGANDIDWDAHIADLKRARIRVIALGVGTAAGGFIPNGKGGFLKDDQGAVVESHLDSTVLRRLADETGGVYRDASNWVDVAGIVRATVAAGRAGNFAAARTGEPIERFQWPLAAAFLFLVLSLCREFPPLPRARTLRWVGGVAAGVVLFGARADTGAEPPQELLAQMVDRLATSPQKPSALDWADMAQQTVTWGRGFSEEGEAVPTGPVYDALAAVAAGRTLDHGAADWTRIEADLKTLLQPPPPKPKPPPQQQNNSPHSTENPPPPGESPPPPPEPADDSALVGPLQQLEHVRQGDSPAQLFQLLAQKRPQRPHAPPDPKPW